MRRFVHAGSRIQKTLVQLEDRFRPRLVGAFIVDECPWFTAPNVAKGYIQIEQWLSESVESFLVKIAIHRSDDCGGFHLDQRFAEAVQKTVPFASGEMDVRTVSVLPFQNLSSLF
jgi:hypothetical protein